LSRVTIRSGRLEIERGVEATERVRRAGAGRPDIDKAQPGVKSALERLVDPLTRGDPTSPLRWTCKSRAKLAAALSNDGWQVSSTTVGRLLHELGYSLQSVRKSREGDSHPDRNEQFEHINTTAAAFLSGKQPVISVDTKKKELVGDFKNAGREWQPQAAPEKVLVHDFPGDAIGKAIPYGVYDMARNEAWVNVGSRPRHAQVRCRVDPTVVEDDGQARVPGGHATLHHGGRGGKQRVPLTCVETRTATIRRRRAAAHPREPLSAGDEQVEQDRASPLLSHHAELARQTAANVRDARRPDRKHPSTAAGLRVKANLDSRKYRTGVEITKAQMSGLALRPHEFHGE
jgi:transposase